MGDGKSSSSASISLDSSQGLSENYHIGVVFVLTASMMSGISTALTQRALAAAAYPRHAFLFSAELAFFGILFLIGYCFFQPADKELLLSGTLFANWSTQTFIPVTTNVKPCSMSYAHVL